MISRVLEWYRIVNVQPSNETIERRKAAIAHLVKAYDDAKQWDVVLDAVAGVIAGFEVGHAQDSAAVTQIISSLHAQDSTVPNDLSDNALELRAVAATAIGEVISRNSDKPADDTAVFLALTVESGLGIRPRPKERYVSQMLDELSAAARRTLSNAQQARRRRSATVGKKVLALDENAEPAAAVKSLTTALKSTLREFGQQAALDREELDILWWLFAGASSTAGKQFSAMQAGAASIAAGAELAGLCLLPPPSNANAFVLKAVAPVKKVDAKRAFEKVMEETDATVRDLLVPPGDASTLGQDYPQLFPLSWLCHRLKESNGAAAWAAEYRAKTGLDADESLDSATVAVQAFRERITQRQYASINEE